MTPGEIRTALEDAWNVIHPFNDPASDCSFPKVCRKCNRFTRLLDAEAWTDAAMMLVPEGWRTAIRSFEDGTAAAMAWHPLEDQPAWAERKPNLPLALAAACIKAKEQADG